jgi:hypothetical protein
MKKLLFIALILIFVIFIAACDPNKTPVVPTETTEPTEVVDTTSPIFFGIEDIVIYVGESFDPLFGVTATDDIDGNLTNQITFTGFVNINIPGTYILTYSVSDQSNNQTTLTREVIVRLRPIDAAIMHYQSASSFTMTILFQAQSESHVMLVEIDENKMLVDAIDEVIYYEIVNDVCYLYEMNQLMWTKQVVECSEKGTLELQFLTQFNASYFEQELVGENVYYVLKSEYYQSLQLFLGSSITSNFKMTLKNEQLDQISFTMIRNSISFDMTITFTKFGTTIVSLPVVNPS